MQYSLYHSGTRFLSFENKITQFPGGFRLKFKTKVSFQKVYIPGKSASLNTGVPSLRYECGMQSVSRYRRPLRRCMGNKIPVSIKHGLRTGTLGIKHGLGTKSELRTTLLKTLLIRSW